MGQFYKGTEAAFIDDKMYKAPYELMAQVIDKKDKAIDDTIGKYQGYLDKLQADVLEQDSPELRKTIAEYQNRIDAAVQGISSDPMNYQKYTPDLNTLGRDITNTWSSTGQVGMMESNKKEVTKRMKYLDDYLAKNPNEADYVEKKRKAILADYQSGLQFDKETGRGIGKLDSDSEMYKLDTNEDFLKDLKAQGIEWKKTTNGKNGYIYEKNGKTNILTEEEIADRYIDYVKANPHITNALLDRKKIGTQGFEDVNVDNAKKLKVDSLGNPILKDGQPQYELNPNNYVGAKAIAAGRFKQDDRTTGNDIQADSTYQWSVTRADAQAASMAALGATTEQIKLEGKEWYEANTQFLNGVKDFGVKYNLPKDYNSAQPMKSLEQYTKSVQKLYGKNSVKYKEAMLDLRKVYASQQTVANKGFAVLIPKYGVEVTKQIMAAAQNLDKHPETVNLMVGTAQRFNPSTNRFEPMYAPKYATYKGTDGKTYYKKDKAGKKINITKFSDQKELSLLELKAHPEKYGLKASDFNVQVNTEPEYDEETGEEKKKSLSAEEAKTFTGTEKYGKHTPNYYVPNSLQPHYVPGEKGNPKGYYTYDLDINGHYFRMTTPMEKFNIAAGVNVK